MNDDVLNFSELNEVAVIPSPPLLFSFRDRPSALYHLKNPVSLPWLFDG